MRRFVFTATVLFALTAWASGQPSNLMPTASEQLRLFQPNRELLEDLVSHTVELSSANTPTARVKACHAALKDLGNAIKDANDRGDDPERVTELGEHLVAVVKFGLVPSIDHARTTIPVGSGADEIIQLTRAANTDLEISIHTIRWTGKVGTSTRVIATRDRLTEAQKLLSERTRTE